MKRRILVPKEYEHRPEMCSCPQYPVHIPNGSGHQSECRISKLYLHAQAQSFAWRRLADHIRTVTQMKGTGEK